MSSPASGRMGSAMAGALREVTNAAHALLPGKRPADSTLGEPDRKAQLREEGDVTDLFSKGQLQQLEQVLKVGLTQTGQQIASLEGTMNKNLGKMAGELKQTKKELKETQTQMVGFEARVAALESAPARGSHGDVAAAVTAELDRRVDPSRAREMQQQIKDVRDVLEIQLSKCAKTEGECKDTVRKMLGEQHQGAQWLGSRQGTYRDEDGTALDGDCVRVRYKTPKMRNMVMDGLCPRGPDGRRAIAVCNYEGTEIKAKLRAPATIFEEAMRMEFFGMLDAVAGEMGMDPRDDFDVVWPKKGQPMRTATHKATGLVVLEQNTKTGRTLPKTT